jgi:Fe2+ transport system protein FeoA
MICCPNCGYNTVELSGSRMAHVAAWLFSSAGLLRKSSGGVLAETEIESRPDGVCTLAEVKPGSHARVVGFSQLTPVRRAQLRASGLTPGRCVQVIQQSPETAVQVENTELALEAGLASKVNVEEVK